jgi:nucleotide-binding universal stress UspA family protein
VEVSTEEAPIRAIVERSAAFDAIVMGAGEPSLVAVLLGEDEQRVAEAAVSPVLVVRKKSE